MTFAALLLVLATAVQSSPTLAAGDDSFLGPLELSVESGKKEVFKKTFQASDKRAASLEIGNGASGESRAKAVIVVLNGKKICTKKTVNRKTGGAKIPLLLKKKNKIKVVVRGGGAKISMSITARTADFSRLLGYGDSLLAGFQDGSLVETYQVWSFGAQIAARAKAGFILPLISEPGIPPRIKIENGLLIFPQEEPGRRLNPGEDADNLAVPGATVWASLNVKSMGSSNPFYEIILGGERRMVEEAKRRSPTFVILWIGCNDVLGMVTSLDPEDHTNISDFKRDFEKVLKELTGTGSNIVAANLPDVTAVAALMEPLSIHKTIGGVPGDALILITSILKIKLEPDEYLTPYEVSQIRSTVRQFNAELEKLCADYAVPVVDIHKLSQSWESRGVFVGGEALTAEWRGGLFSLDGIHPSNTGHALLANEFIRVINRSYGADIPLVDIESVLQQDPNRPDTGLDAGMVVRPSTTSVFKHCLDLLDSSKSGRGEQRRH